MLRLMFFLFFLIASVWLGLKVLHHPGYLFIVYQPWMIQMPLWLGVVGLIFLFGVLFILFNSVERVQFLWYRIKNWLRFRREQRFFTKTQQGLALLIEGRWKKAERFLLSGANQSAEPLMNYLGAAKAAHELGAYERRDQYFRQAYQIEPSADLAIGLTQAELELQQDQLEQAAATLNRLLQSAPRHPGVLKLLEKVYVRLGDWQTLKELLPKMRKARIFKADLATHFEKNVYCELLRAAGKKNVEELKQVWNDLPRSMKKNPEVVTVYAQQLLHTRAPAKDSEELIRKTLNTQWSAELAKLYGTLPLENVNRQLVIVGAWLKMYGPKPELLLILGRLCVRAQLWGKAKDYFDKCLAQGPNTEASLAYGELLEQLGDEEAAKQKYKTGLATSSVC